MNQDIVSERENARLEKWSLKNTTKSVPRLFTRDPLISFY